MKLWSRFLYAGQKTFSSSSRRRWLSLVEIGLASLLILGGFVFFVAALAWQNLFPGTPQAVDGYEGVGGLAIRIVLALLALVIGLYRMLLALWKVSTSVERRRVWEAAAGELTPFRVRREKDLDFPTVPGLGRSVVPGQRLRYQLRGRRRSYFWLMTLALLTLAGSGIATLTLARFRFSFFPNPQAEVVPDYTALAMAFIAGGLGVWAAIGFFRQALRLAAFGPTVLEIADLPIVPGKKNRILLSQPGRFRFKLLEVLLRCEEVTTFSRGTDIQTERKIVEEIRLLRQRGVDVTPQRPYETEIEWELPSQSCHSFVSQNNQVQWKFVVQTLAKGWPQFEQIFPVVVRPPNETA